MWDAESLLCSATRAFLPPWSGKEGTRASITQNITDAQYRNIESHLQHNTEHSGTNLCFNYSTCWEIRFVSRSNNSCRTTLIKMYILNLFSHKGQPMNLLKKVLHTNICGGGKTKRKASFICLLFVKPQQIFFLEIFKTYYQSPTVFLCFTSNPLPHLSTCSLNSEQFWTNYNIWAQHKEIWSTFSVLLYYSAYGYHCPLRQSTTLRAHCTPDYFTENCFPGKYPLSSTLCPNKYR